MTRRFFFGAATSAHQVEGGTNNDWSAWEQRNANRLAAEAKHFLSNKEWEEHILSGHPHPHQEENYISGRATDHYHRFAEDFDIARSLKHNAHRFSIEWSRVEPREGVFDQKEIDHYIEVIAALRARDIEPFVTLWHWTLPTWLAEKGGAEHPGFSAYLARFGAKMAEAFRGKVKFWMTINEPEIFASAAYYRGLWPPQKKNFFTFWKVIYRLVSAHRETYRAIKAIDPETQVGVVVDLVYFESESGRINQLLRWLGHRLWNLHFLNRVYRTLDFIGLNYYFHSHVHWGFGKNKNERISDMGWEIYPEGIYHILKSLSFYELPIYVTENGVADARDAHRGYFLAEHLEWIKKAIREGVNVRGYFYWSLLDNFEWDKGFWPRFGLVEVNYKTLARKVRPSALIYKKIIEAWEEEQHDA